MATIIINTDGGCRSNSKGKPGEAAAAFVACTEDGRHLASQSELLVGTNNAAEYRGVALAALALPLLVKRYRDLMPFDIEIRSDSMLVVCQMNRDWRTKNPDMLRLSEACRELLRVTDCEYRFVWVPRTQNREPDYLCNLALDGQVKTDLFAPMPRSHARDGKATAGQLFHLHGELSTPRPVRVDREGYALCNGCGARLRDCTCPALNTINKAA